MPPKSPCSPIIAWPFAFWEEEKRCECGERAGWFFLEMEAQTWLNLPSKGDLLMKGTSWETSTGEKGPSFPA